MFELQHHHQLSEQHLANLKSVLFDEDRDNWLDDESLRVAANYNLKYLCFCRRNKILLYKCSKKDADFTYFELSSAEEQVTSVAFATTEKTSKTTQSKFFTVVLVGSSLGYLRFFTLKGKLIYEQQFHDSPISRIKAKSFIQMSSSAEQDEILVIYPRIVVKIDCKSLAQYIQEKLKQATKTSTNAEPDIHFTYKKWFLSGQDKVNDANFYVEEEVSPLDVLKSKPPYTLIAVGYNPIIQGYSSNDSEQGSISASKVATEVAVKVTSVMFSFAKNLIFGSESTSEKKQKKESEEPAKLLKKGIYIEDSPREIFNIAMDMTDRFAVTSDSLGRVMLLDVQSMVIMRVLKGYRNAQCGWLYEPNYISGKHNHSGRQFTIVHAPLRGLLELWDVNGERAYAMNVGTGSMIVQTPTVISSAPSNVLSSSFLSKQSNQNWIVISASGKISKVAYKQIALEEKAEKASILTMFPSKRSQTSSRKSKHSNDESTMKQFSQLSSSLDSSSDKATVQKLKSTIERLESFSNVIQALDLLDDSVADDVLLELTEAAMNKHRDYKNFFQNRISIIKAFGLLRTITTSPSVEEPEHQDEDFELVDRQEIEPDNHMQSWRRIVQDGKLFDRLLAVDTLSRKSKEVKKEGMPFRGCSSFLDCFDFTEKNINISPKITTVQKKALADFIFSSSKFIEVFQLLNLHCVTIQELFCMWVLSTSVEEIYKQPPQLFAKLLMLTMQDAMSVHHHRSTGSPFSRILHHCRHSENVHNCIILLKLCIAMLERYKQEFARTNSQDLTLCLGQLQDLLNIKFHLKSSSATQLETSPATTTSSDATSQLQLPKLSLHAIAKHETNIFDLVAMAHLRSTESTPTSVHVGPHIQQLLEYFAPVSAVASESLQLLLFYCIQESSKRGKVKSSSFYISQVSNLALRTSIALVEYDHLVSAVFSKIIEELHKTKKMPSIKHLFGHESQLKHTKSSTSVSSPSQQSSPSASHYFMDIKSDLDILGLISYAQELLRNIQLQLPYIEDHQLQVDETKATSWIPKDYALLNARQRLLKRKASLSSEFFVETLSLLQFLEVLFQHYDRAEELPSITINMLFSLDAILHLHPNFRLSHTIPKKSLTRHREQFLTLLLPQHWKLAEQLCVGSLQEEDDMAVAFAEIPTDFVYIEYIKWYYAQCSVTEEQQLQADHLFNKIHNKVKAATKLVLEVARTKMGSMVQQLSSDKRTLPLLSEMNPELFQWITQHFSLTAAAPQTQTQPSVLHDVLKLQTLLEKCVQFLQEKTESVEYRAAVKMLEFMEKVIVSIK